MRYTARTALSDNSGYPDTRSLRADFVLLAVLDDSDGALPSPELASRLGLTRSRLVLQLLPLEKCRVVARDAAVHGQRKVTLTPSGRRLLRESRDTAAAVCAEARLETRPSTPSHWLIHTVR